MPLTDPELILQLYKPKIQKLEDLSRKIEFLIGDFLNRENIEKPLISRRVKDYESLLKKCIKKSKYNSLDDITDLVGIRITTLLEGEIDKVAKVIEREFEVDVENTIDKRKSMEPEKFGYLSLHYVVSIKQDRLEMIEYSDFKGIRFEIQIRSMLQNAWAEIEHDIGYKMKEDVPEHIRRKFSQAASLLEVADRYFNEIKDETEKYAISARENLNGNADFINIDSISLNELIRSELVDSLENKITSKRLRIGKSDISSHLLERIRDADFNNLVDLKRYYENNSDRLIKFYEKNINLDLQIVDSIMYYPGFSIYGLCYIKMSDDKKDIAKYLSDITGEIDEHNYHEIDFNKNILDSIDFISNSD